MRKSHILIVSAVIILAGCTGGTPGTEASPQQTDPATEASQNIYNTFIISNETLIVNKTVESDQEVPEYLDCTSVGVDAMLTYLDQQIDDEIEGVSVGTRHDEDGMLLMSISRETVRGQVRTTAGTEDTPTVISRPSISYQRLRTVAPSKTSITVTHENGSVSCHAPVTVLNVSAGLD